MSNLGGLNLGGADKNPATPPSGPAETKQPETKPTESQKDAEASPETPKSQPEIADAVAALDSTLREDNVVRWSVHPIQRYTVGDYHFENGLLVLKEGEEADKFQAVYDSLPVYEQTRINKIDLGAAEAMVRERLATGGGATKGIDSSTGDRAPNKQVGQGDLITGQ